MRVAFARFIIIRRGSLSTGTETRGDKKIINFEYINNQMAEENNKLRQDVDFFSQKSGRYDEQNEIARNRECENNGAKPRRANGDDVGRCNKVYK